MKKSNIFRILYWIFTALYISFTGFALAIIANEIIYAPGRVQVKLLGILIFVALIIAVPVMISIFVYKDSSKRRMNKWLWMLIATYIPNFIGVIIYFIVRSDNFVKCVNCDKKISNDFDICPYCGEKVTCKCSECGKNVHSDWIACPYCEKKLK